MAARGISMAANLVVVPVVAHRLNAAEFGLWLNLTTVFVMLAVLDYGLGPAVMGQISEARGKDDIAGMRRVVSTAMVMLSGAALVVLAVAGALALTVGWSEVLGVGKEVPGARVNVLLFAVAATVALNLPLMIARRVYYGLQRGHVVALFTLLGAALQCAGLLVVAVAAPDLRWFMAAYLVAPLVADLAATLVLLGRGARELRPRLVDVDRRTTGQLGKEGLQLFLLMATGVVAFQVDSFIIGHYLGVSRVPEYVLAFRVFSLLPAFAAMFLTPLWAAYREAQARGEREWMHRAYVRSVLLTTAVALPAASALVVVTPPLLHAWVGGDVASPSPGLLAALACYAVVTCVSSAVGVFLKGLGALHVQLGLGAVMVVLNVAASIWSVTRIGLAGPLWASVATQTCVGLIPCLFYARRCLAGQRELARCEPA
jgi:O-antigen/teichoic acid export membrane protein